MKFERWMASKLMMLACVGGLICCQLRPLDGEAQSSSVRANAGYAGAGKVLIPHKSWPCGMAEGIPVPERGVLVFEANLKLGFEDDERDYSACAEILKDLGFYRVRLLSNNPRKVVGLDGYGLEIVEQVSL